MDILPPRRNAVATDRVRPAGEARAPGDEAPRGGAAGLPVPTQAQRGGNGGGFAPLQRASAPLMAQLIAARLDMPQTRRLRRASPAVAEGAYARAEALKAPAARRRSLRI